MAWNGLSSTSLFLSTIPFALPDPSFFLVPPLVLLLPFPRTSAHAIHILSLTLLCVLYSPLQVLILAYKHLTTFTFIYYYSPPLDQESTKVTIMLVFLTTVSSAPHRQPGLEEGPIHTFLICVNEQMAWVGGKRR